MIAAIHQPQYLPWLGYFDKIDRADVFVILDNVQFKKNEYQNRNRIKTAQGWQWLTVPVGYRFPQKISEVTVNNNTNWRHKHWQALVTNYARAACFADHAPAYEAFLGEDWGSLADLNTRTVRDLVTTLGITTPLRVASDWDLPEDPTGRLVRICVETGADTYLSGAGGQDYLDLRQFETAGIDVLFQEYSHPEYPQQFGSFEPYMSAVDLLFNCGPDSLGIIRSGRSA